MSWKQDLNKRALIIVRRSGKGQEENTSAETQLNGAIKYISEHGLEEAGRFNIIETAYVSDDRKKYKKLMRDSIKSGIKHYLFYHSSRETRNHVDASWTESLVRADKMILHHISENRVYWKGTSDADWLMRDFQTTVNAHSSRETSTRVKEAYQTKIANGIYPYCWVALGYRHQKDKDDFGNPIQGTAKLIVDPTEAKVKLVRREFSLRAQGLSYDQIRTANLHDDLVPENLKRSYNRSSIQRRLNNRLYWGEIHEKKSGLIHKGVHPLIIDKHILKIVELVNNSQTRSGIRIKPIDHDGGHFRRFFNCGNSFCGCAVTYEAHEKPNRKTGGQKVYDLYRCANSKKVHDKNSYVNEVEIWSLIDSGISSFIVSKSNASKLASGLSLIQDFQSGDLKKEIKTIQKCLVDLADQRSKTVELFRNGQIQKRDFDGEIEGLTKSENRLLERLQDSENSLNQIAVISDGTIEGLSLSFAALWDGMGRSEKGNLLRLITQSATLTYLPLTESIEIFIEFKTHFTSLTGWLPIRGFKMKRPAKP